MGEIVRLPNRRLLARVRRGARLLDEVRPGWAEEIDLRHLGGLKNDVLEQLYGDHEVAGRALGFPSLDDALERIYQGEPQMREVSFPEYGFAVFGDDLGGDLRGAYQEMRRLWREEVRRRLKPAPGQKKGPKTGQR